MIKNWLEIDGQVFDVIVTEITESGTILYSDNTGRTISQGARMSLDPLGTFYNYKVTVKRNGSNVADYDRLYDYILTPRYTGMAIKAVHNQSTINFDAYVSAAERKVKKIDKNNKVVYWDEMSISITSMEAQVLPNG